MSDKAPRVVLDRLRAVEWDDSDAAFDHARSRALLMREYLRRAALWAREYGVEALWPFFDIAEHAAPSVTVDPAVAAETEEFLRRLIARDSVKKTCRSAVHWAAVYATEHVPLPELPDPYEPLLLMYERGGGFYVEEFIELNGIAIREGNVASNLNAPPFLTLSPVTLNALDGEGAITYYSIPGGLMRRRVDYDGTHEETLSLQLTWQSTDEQLKLAAPEHEGANSVYLTEISEREAASYIEGLTHQPG
ncbi:hypothetical protein ACFP1Z_05125 [Streptomyces gamaensis]|uniref:DUF4238 domain-containing protein n=1 Tax=Streptomyces gamaensis TaxID=1763542 RepID=A0ABW0YYS8_9ACTN